MKATELHWLALFILLLHPASTASLQCDVNNDARFDCLPGADKTPEATCEARGCCWKPTLISFHELMAHEKRIARLNLTINFGEYFGTGINVPQCFYPKDYNGYHIVSLKETDTGYTGSLDRVTHSGWPNDIEHLSFDVWFETESRIHIKITDDMRKRYEVPIETPPLPSKKPSTTDYDINFIREPFSFSVTRKSTKETLFDSSVAPLIFSDQFIQLSSLLSSNLIYGVGEHKGRLLKNTTNWQRYVLWSHDHPPEEGVNLYSSQPFYLNIEKSGKVHGVFLLNSNAMEIDLTPLPGLTFRTIGGVLDLYILTGPSADDVVEQFAAVVGLPHLPPYWGLGFHLCRFGYTDSKYLKKIIDRNRAIGIPYEAQWNDMDYARAMLDWTYDKSRYPDLPDIVADLHAHNQKYLILIDPGISSTQAPGSYPPYDDGLVRDIFIKNSSGLPLVGQVWPGDTVYPDWTHPNVTDWWYELMRDFHKEISFDGFWIDMNEPDSFVDGSVNGCHEALDSPPYVPAVEGGNLNARSLCLSAKQYLSTQYNLHSLYGLNECNVTQRALNKVVGKRNIMITRSSFPSMGRYGGKWSGDVTSNWDDLAWSIPAILEFQFFAVPLYGAIVCGFFGDVTEELCIRWMQLGSFYPFMINHNEPNRKDQDPAAFSLEAQRIMNFTLIVRYTMMPYYYTQFYLSHITGRPVIRPLFFQYPDDPNTYNIDDQFLWGTAILVSPALKQGQREVNAYFPKDMWYHGLNVTLIESKGERVKLDAPLDFINFHFRGGEIVTLQKAGVTTTETRQNGIALLVAFNSTQEAYGWFYWDDGESLNSVDTEQYVLMEYYASKPSEPMQLFEFMIFGVETKPNSVVINGQAVPFIYLSAVKELHIQDFSVSILKPFTLQWN